MLDRLREWWPSVAEFLASERAESAIRALILVIVGFLLAKLATRAIGRLSATKLEPQQVLLSKRATFFGIFGLFLATALHQLGFNFGVLLGAAGIFSVAIGFASQTSASNLISGLFLIAEKPFQIGDIIKVQGTTGEVLAIDLLSVKLRAFDNTFIRIPNETLIKSEVRTLTKFPIRRVDLTIGIAYHEDVERARHLLFDLADRNPLCLQEPRPAFIFLGFGASSIDLQFSPWATRENYLELKNTFQEEVKYAFDQAGIEIPFPHVTVYAGSKSEAFPVRQAFGVDGAETAQATAEDSDEASETSP